MFVVHRYPFLVRYLTDFRAFGDTIQLTQRQQVSL
jgi:hypothetical protein